MVLLLPKRQSFGEQIGAAIGGGLGEGFSRGQRLAKEAKELEAENQAVKAQYGIDLSGIKNPEQRKNILQGHLEQQKQSRVFEHQMNLEREKSRQEEREISEKLKSEKGKELEKTREKTAPFISGLETIKRMREIGLKGNLGRGSEIFGAFGGETSQDIGEYEQLGKSLISLSSNIPIRNQQEFQTLAENLYNPHLPDREREGILNAIEQIIMNNLQQFEGVEEDFVERKSAKQRPSLSSFMR